MKSEKNWQRNIWNICNHWDHELSGWSYEHYSSVPYSDDASDEVRILKLSIPRGKDNLPVIVWFHGGGFTGDQRECPRELFETEKYLIVEPRYSLAPAVKAPVYIEDAAMALAWVMKNIKDFGGDPDKIVVGGMSAGAYLSMVISMNPKWLNAYGLDNKDLAAIVSLSGQVSTHFIVAEDLGLGAESEYAPLSWISDDLPPIQLIVGDVACDVSGRTEENIRMAVKLHETGHNMVETHSLGGKDHSGAFLAGGRLIVPFLEKSFALKLFIDDKNGIVQYRIVSFSLENILFRLGRFRRNQVITGGSTASYQFDQLHFSKFCAHFQRFSGHCHAAVNLRYFFFIQDLVYQFTGGGRIFNNPNLFDFRGDSDRLVFGFCQFSHLLRGFEYRRACVSVIDADQFMQRYRI